ncbi:hypothetical protein BpKM390_46560 [Burkholderia pseudomallei]|nr:hypothetical protein TKS_45810 [Burkholderia pseudomallei]BEH63411.1 hypothetical protein BpKM390_46560 [Burkholderia pseudomallei]
MAADVIADRADRAAPVARIARAACPARGAPAAPGPRLGASGNDCPTSTPSPMERV